MTDPSAMQGIFSPRPTEVFRHMAHRLKKGPVLTHAMVCRILIRGGRGGGFCFVYHPFRVEVFRGLGLRGLRV